MTIPFRCRPLCLLSFLAGLSLVSAGLRDESSPVADTGWLYSDWFGYFYPQELTNNVGWVYADGRGWFYTDENSGQLWMWSQASDWIWVDRGWYPQVFLSNGNGGGYYQDMFSWARAGNVPANPPANPSVGLFVESEGDNWIAYSWDGASWSFDRDSSNIFYDPASGIPQNPQIGDYYSTYVRRPYRFGREPQDVSLGTWRLHYEWDGSMWETVGGDFDE